MFVVVFTIERCVGGRRLNSTQSLLMHAEKETERRKTSRNMDVSVTLELTLELPVHRGGSELERSPALGA